MDKTEDTLLVRPTAGTSGSSGMTRYGRSREEDTVQALMDLSLPRFTRLEDGRLPKTKLWPITEQPPSSPASVRDDSVTRTPSPCYQLDDLTSVSSEGGTTRIGYTLSLVTDSSLSVTPVGSIVSFSDDDLPLDYVDELGREDTRRVETRDVMNDAPLGPTEVPEFIPLSAQTPMEEPLCTPVDPDRPVGVPVNKDPPADDVMFDPMLGEWPIDTLSSPEDGAQKMTVGGKLPPTPTKTMTGILIHPDDVLRVSPPMNSSGDPGVLSAPLSPNRVRQGHSQDMPAEGSLFAVSPDTPGYSMRPAGVVVQSAEVSEPPPPNYVGFNNPFFGTPIAFAQCQNTAGMDTTTTLPVYNIPRDCSVGVDQSSVPTIYASGVTPDSIPWSTAEDIIRDIAREGPFDPDTTPMDTEDSPLINTSMPGCPFRMTSYTGPAMVDSDTRYGLQLHHPRFLEFIGAPESARLLNQSPSFWVDRLGQASAMAAAMNLQRDAGFMMTNLQILEQFVMSLHRMSAEMLSIGVNHAVFPVDEVDRLSVMPRAQRAAKYMSAMGLWRPPSGVSAPGPLPVSTCTSCMNCESCFGRRGPSAQ